MLTPRAAFVIVVLPGTEDLPNNCIAPATLLLEVEFHCGGVSLSIKNLVTGIFDSRASVQTYPVQIQSMID